ncbi:MAG: 50S ribosomal protein L17 [Candidatus Wildermuthbacteria bacterium]|nr:50S ribosomal protein L17 [Candidatus Wildermuthbacteria bacterium]
MNKRKKGRKFSMKADPRRALLHSLLRALVDKEKIETTEAKAREMRSFAEKLITKAKEGSLAQRRNIAKTLGEALTKKLIEKIAPAFKDRKGGYTRVIKLGSRESDSARLAIIELVK